MSAAASSSRSQLRTGLIAAAVALGMVGVAYAAVPLYRVFCQVTGFGGTTMRATSVPSDDSVRALNGRTIKVRFDGNVRGLPWNFAPTAQSVEIRIGEQNMAFYRASSGWKTATTGAATFNVSPASAGKYFAKIQCFCFNEQTLNPGQSVEMPVVFYVDPAILDDPDAKNIDEITLSYTFFPIAEPTKAPRIYATGQAAIPKR
jgi:cytochrome c oxidase assembly protein subunit 11